MARLTPKRTREDNRELSELTDGELRAIMASIRVGSDSMDDYLRWHDAMQELQERRRTAAVAARAGKPVVTLMGTQKGEQKK